VPPDGGSSSFVVGETFATMGRAIALGKARLASEDPFGRPKDLHIGSVPLSLFTFSANGMGGMVVLRQDAGRVCVIGQWAWQWGGDGVDVGVAAVSQIPSRDGILVVLKASGSSPHGTEESSYYPDMHLLSAFLITPAAVDEVLSESVDQNDSTPHDEWLQSATIKTVGSSVRLIYKRQTWILAPGASEFLEENRRRTRR
jgi:hypothetical protein